MSEEKEKYMSYLEYALPEDILKKKYFGDFTGAKQLIDEYMKKDIPEEYKQRLQFESKVLEILPKEYTWSEERALSEIKTVIPDFTEYEFDELVKQGEIDWYYVNGEVRYFRRFLSTLLKVNKEIKRRAEEKTGVQTEDEESVDVKEKKALHKVIRSLIEKKELTYHLKIKAGVKIVDSSFMPGTVRVHLPLPIEDDHIKNINICHMEPKAVHISNQRRGQKTSFFGENLTENRTFEMEYEYDNHVSYVRPDRERIGRTIQPELNRQTLQVEHIIENETDTPLTEDFTEQVPHIKFTPYLKALAEKIAGNITNPYDRARAVYDYVTTKVTYAFMREYITIEEIPQYAALRGRGDCGVQALLFITLCRILKIPARWQSGLYTTPYSAGSHDWAQFYLAPYGWLFADCSFGGSAYREGDMERWNFYFGNLDPFRMPANSAFQKEFEPPKRFLRADPYDNQRGEIEYGTRGLSYDEFDSKREVLECYEISE